MLTKILRIVLIVLEFFLSITAILGGLALLAGLGAPPVEMLAGSPFKDYTIPGLALAVIVGGGALAAAILLLRRHKWSALAAAASGVIIIFFEIVEVISIGMTPGASQVMQILYLVIGVLLLLAGAGLYLTARQ
jgi:hypothetical protein